MLSAFETIPERQCTHTPFNGDAVPANLLRGLEAFTRSTAIDLRLFTEPRQKERITEIVVAGNSIQMDDDAFIEELRSWIRFNEAEALEIGDGLSYRSVDSPPSPRWLGKILFGMMFRKGPENDKYRQQIERSAGIAIFICKDQSQHAWVEAGRAYQRFALLSTARGLRHAFINQPVDVPEIREQLASSLNLGDRLPDLIIRFGYGEPPPSNAASVGRRCGGPRRFSATGPPRRSTLAVRRTSGDRCEIMVVVPSASI